jgi:threonine dehydratase
MSAALAAGKVIEVEVGDTIADGLSGNIETGSITVDIASGLVDRIVSVSEAEIHDALRFLASEHGLIAEGAGAATLAAVLAGKTGPTRGEIVAIVSGRNIALPRLAEVFAG